MNVALKVDRFNWRQFKSVCGAWNCDGRVWSVGSPALISILKKGFFTRPNATVCIPILENCRAENVSMLLERVSDILKCVKKGKSASFTFHGKFDEVNAFDQDCPWEWSSMGMAVGELFWKLILPGNDGSLKESELKEVRSGTGYVVEVKKENIHFKFFVCEKNIFIKTFGFADNVLLVVEELNGIIRSNPVKHFMAT